MQPNDYPNIIFDLGGVVLNIDYTRTTSAFQKLGITDFETRYSQIAQTFLFDDFETGAISPSEFRDGIRTVFDNPVTDEMIDKAWNAMLLNLPEERLKLLSRLARSKRIVLLSNTNAIHIEAFSNSLQTNFGIPNLSPYFQKLYYSFEVGMRKPEAKIFNHVIEEQQFDPSETLFIDDSPQHIQGAREIGLRAYHLRADRGETILDLF